MDEKDKFDLKSLANDCGLFSDLPSEEIVRRISDLDNRYQSGDLVSIYNYFLSVSTKPDVLMHIIKLADNKNISIFKSYFNVITTFLYGSSPLLNFFILSLFCNLL